MIMLVIATFVCYSPLIITAIIETVKGKDVTEDFKFIAQAISVTFINLQSLVNPLIVSLRMSRIRTSVGKKTIGPTCSKRKKSIRISIHTVNINKFEISGKHHWPFRQFNSATVRLSQLTLANFQVLELFQPSFLFLRKNELSSPHKKQFTPGGTPICHRMRMPVISFIGKKSEIWCLLGCQNKQGAILHPACAKSAKLYQIVTSKYQW